MKLAYNQPHIKVCTLSTNNCIAVSIGGSSELYPSESPDGGLFEVLNDNGELSW